MPTPLALPDPSHPLLDLSAVEQGARIRDGSLTSRLLVELYLSRIARHNGALGAFVQVLAGQARREADRLDQERWRGKLRGPLHGVPTAIKDMNAVRGARLRFGSRAWRYLVSPVDDRLVRAVRAAGMPILGKTATSELAVLPIVETDLHPPARNPWNPAHTAGGSSGGAGAAIAAGLVPLAPGSDGAGSIRIPAALNGLVGLKPSRGLVPDDIGAIDIDRMTTNGPLGRCVDDVAALLDALAVPGTAAFAASQAPVPRLRIGVVLDPPVGEVDPEIAARIEQIADALRAAGHHVERRPRIEGSVSEFAPIYQALIARVPVLAAHHLQPFTAWFRAQGRLQRADDLRRRFASLDARGRAAMDGVDVLLTPTVPITTPRVGAFAHVPPDQLFEAVAPLGTFTAISNVTGLPALSMPAGFVGGLPVGAQLIGAPGADGLLLALGRQLEQLGGS